MIQKFSLYTLVGFVLFSCSQKEEVKEKTTSSFKEIYEFSETALLMEKMYEELNSKREAIIHGEEIGEYPIEFNKIHTAKLSDGFERNEEFKRFSDLYLQNLKALYDASPTDPNRKAIYNNVVNSCITCHKSDAGCMGPVSRIGKLLIN
jgi:cytochrome c556